MLTLLITPATEPCAGVVGCGWGVVFLGNFDGQPEPPLLYFYRLGMTGFDGES